MFGAVPKEWVLTFEEDGGKVKMIVIARTFIGARAFAPPWARNVKARRRKPGGKRSTQTDAVSAQLVSAQDGKAE